MGTKTSRIPRIPRSWVSIVEIERDEGPLASPVDALFTATQRRLLGLLFGEPTHAFYLRELLALTGGGHGATQRELRRLIRAGLVRATREGGRSYLQADPRSPVHAELCALLRNTIGLAEPLRQAFELAEPFLRLCFAFEPERDPGCRGQRGLGLVVMAKSSPIPSAALDYGRELAESRLPRSIGILSIDTARLRDDAYVAAVLQRPRVWVFGSEAELAAELAAAAAAKPPGQAVDAG